MIRALTLCVLATAALAAAVAKNGAYVGHPPPAHYTPPPHYPAGEPPKPEHKPPPKKEEHKAPPKKEYQAPPPHYTAPHPPTEKCWVETRKCCYEEKQDGYVCQDDYAMKQARCHPKITYERKCDKTEGRPPMPEPYVNEYECSVVKYDPNYGPHVQGYPKGGKSEKYDTKELPKKPYKVEADPYPPHTYQPQGHYQQGYAPPHHSKY